MEGLEFLIGESIDILGVSTRLGGVSVALMNVVDNSLVVDSTHVLDDSLHFIEHHSIDSESLVLPFHQSPALLSEVI